MCQLRVILLKSCELFTTRLKFLFLDIPFNYRNEKIKTCLKKTFNIGLNPRESNVEKHIKEFKIFTLPCLLRHKNLSCTSIITPSLQIKSNTSSSPTNWASKTSFTGSRHCFTLQLGCSWVMWLKSLYSQHRTKDPIVYCGYFQTSSFK